MFLSLNMFFPFTNSFTGSNIAKKKHRNLSNLEKNSKNSRTIAAAMSLAVLMSKCVILSRLIRTLSTENLLFGVHALYVRFSRKLFTVYDIRLFNFLEDVSERW
jgi:hypothetical protein